MRVISDDTWATLTLFGEARGESFLGKVAVGEVLRTRMTRRIQSDGTVLGTIMKARQFSCWMDGDPNRLAMGEVHLQDAAWIECVAAWGESATSITTRGATHYLAVESVLRAAGRLPSWACDPTDPLIVSPALVTLVEGRHTFVKL